MRDPGPTLQKLLATPVPDTLYHYTSVEGLDGIASSRTIWASAARYMNDAKEFTLAVDIARRHVAKRESEESDRNRARLFRYLHDQLERVESLEVCIFSLSREGDLLSQWRAYCPPNGGYSIGFPGSLLRAVMAPQGGMLVPCEYERRSQVQLVEEALAPALRDLPNSVPEGDEAIKELGEEHVGALFNQLIFVAPLIKHHSFEEEHEWRLIWIPGRSDPNRLRFRVGSGTYVPFVPLSLDHNGQSIPFAEVVIGPMPDQDSARRALGGGIRERGTEWQSLRTSKVPYRTW